MRLSAKAEYACVAMVELAAQYTKGQPVSIKAIAETYGISNAFLMQILLQLKGAGLVASSRGASGGYQLSRPPEAITLAEVIDVIDGPPGVSALADLPESGVVSTLTRVQQQVLAAERKILDEHTLANVLQQAREGDALYYQI